MDIKAVEMLLIDLTVIDLHFLLPFAVDAVAHDNLHPVVVREPPLTAALAAVWILPVKAVRPEPR